jgi:hypothetical protein
MALRVQGLFLTPVMAQQHMKTSSVPHLDFSWCESHAHMPTIARLERIGLLVGLTITIHAYVRDVYCIHSYSKLSADSSFNGHSYMFAYIYTFGVYLFIILQVQAVVTSNHGKPYLRKKKRVGT